MWPFGRPANKNVAVEKEEICPFEESVGFSTSRTLLRAEIFGKQRLRAGTWIEAFIAPRGEHVRQTELLRRFMGEEADETVLARAYLIDSGTVKKVLIADLLRPANEVL